MMCKSQQMHCSVRRQRCLVQEARDGAPQEGDMATLGSLSLPGAVLGSMHSGSPSLSDSSLLWAFPPAHETKLGLKEVNVTCPRSHG